MYEFFKAGSLFFSPYCSSSSPKSAELKQQEGSSLLEKKVIEDCLIFMFILHS